jgi:hypothetical protein
MNQKIGQGNTNVIQVQSGGGSIRGVTTQATFSSILSVNTGAVRASDRPKRCCDVHFPGPQVELHPLLVSDYQQSIDMNAPL